MSTATMTVGFFICLWIGYKVGHLDGRMNGEFEARMKEGVRRKNQ